MSHLPAHLCKEPILQNQPLPSLPWDTVELFRCEKEHRFVACFKSEEIDQIHCPLCHGKVMMEVAA